MILHLEGYPEIVVDVDVGGLCSGGRPLWWRRRLCGGFAAVVMLWWWALWWWSNLWWCRSKKESRSKKLGRGDERRSVKREEIEYGR